MNKKTLKVTAILLVLGMIMLTGCGTKAASVEKPAATTLNGQNVDPNATITVGLSASVLTLDPANHRDRNTETVIRNMFDGLVTRTVDGKIVPEIAESWKLNSPTVWEFKIRKGITFHDGSPLTADDVQFTFERILKEGALGNNLSSPRKGLLGPVTSVVKVDDFTVQFNLSSPWPIMEQMLPHQQIVPKAYVEKVGSEEFAKKPIGAGPFKFVEGKLDERIVMERYDKYYGGSPDLKPVGLAQAKTVIFEVIPETSTRLASLMSGQIQISQKVPADMIDKVKADNNLLIKSAEGTTVTMFQMNLKQKPFDNVKVRQAMNYAVNIQQIVDTALGGNAVRLAGPVLATSFAVNKDLKPYPYDTAKAKQLLSEAGYPNGFALVIDTEADLKTIAEAAAADLQKVGINATVRIWDWGVLKPLLLKGERSMALTTFGNSTQDPSDFLEPTLKAGGGGNYSHYANPEAATLIDQAKISLVESERKDLYVKAQAIIYNEAPWVFGYAMKQTEASSKKIVNWESSMDSRINLHDVGILAK